MKFANKAVLAAATVTLGLATLPASAQVRTYDAAPGYGTRPSGVAPGYDEYGSLNVFGARLDPRPSSTGLVGGLGNTVGGVVGGVGSAVGGVVGGVGSVVGGTVNGVTRATGDLVTGTVGDREAVYTGSRKRYPARDANRSRKNDHPFSETVRN